MAPYFGATFGRFIRLSRNDPKISRIQFQRAAHAWLSSAERLRAAVEVILQHEAQTLAPFHDTYRKAEAQLDDPEISIAEIQADPPNYPSGELLFGYALENILKGLIIANDPTIPNETALDSKITKYKLIELAADAKFQICSDEAKVLEALTTLIQWAGRYPVALRIDRHTTIQALSDTAELMNYGRDHVRMRALFDRASAELESKLPGPRVKYSILRLD